MAENLEAELENLKKELWYLKKSIPQQSGGDFNEQLSSFRNEINAKFETLTPQIDSFTEQISNLTEQTSNLSEQASTFNSEISNLIDNVIPELQESIGNGGSGGEGSRPQWQIYYDRESPDPKINWGLPKGIMGKDNIVKTSPNFIGYTHMKLTFEIGEYYTSVVYDIRSEKMLESYPIHYFSFLCESLFVATCALGYNLAMDFRHFAISSIKRINFTNNKPITMVDLSSNEYYSIIKIEVLTV